MGLLATLVAVAKHPATRAVIRVGIAKAGQAAQNRIESGENMSARQFKWQRLTQEERRARRQAGDAWWQKSARDERQASRKDKRQTGDSLFNRLFPADGWADQNESPTRERRSPPGRSEQSAPEPFPVWQLLAAGSIAWLILKK